MKDRIKKIIESQHMTQQEFAETIKVAPATLSSIFTGRTAPSLKIVEAIKSRFPDISTDWLMFGRGAMTDYKDAESGSQLAAHPPPRGRRLWILLSAMPLLYLTIWLRTLFLPVSPALCLMFRVQEEGRRQEFRLVVGMLIIYLL